MRSKHKQLAIYLLVPCLVTVTAIISQYSGFDLWLESVFYDAPHHTWPYKSLFITSVVLHSWARKLVVLVALANLVAIIASFMLQRLAPYRRYLIYVFVSALSGPLLVGLLKDSTHIYVPWDLSLFGGNMPHIRLFDSVSANAPVGHAFPGGHSSGGFAYLGVYFVLVALHSRYRRIGLIVPLLIGTMFAIDQEVRGAHFLSHDLVSLAICWIMAFCWFMIFFPGHFRTANTMQGAINE